MRPVGYRVQKHVPCCANCLFGGYLGDRADITRLAICEILGEPSDSDYSSIAVEPLGVCDAYKPAAIAVKYRRVKKHE